MQIISSLNFWDLKKKIKKKNMSLKPKIKQILALTKSNSKINFFQFKRMNGFIPRLERNGWDIKKINLLSLNLNEFEQEKKNDKLFKIHSINYLINQELNITLF